ncbi:hypothetical protein [Chryseobacterium sp. ON_d1]|nr:hypothetical protein [Chryseobacterium sp. ON_d1]
MKNLIPLSDFVLEQLKIEQSTSEFKEVVRNKIEEHGNLKT